MNIVGELISSLIAWLILFLIHRSNPRRTKLFGFDRLGIVISVHAIWIQIGLLVYCKYPQYYNRFLFEGLMITYLILYMVVLVLLLGYITMMDSKNWEHSVGYMWTVGIFSVMYLTIIVALLRAGKMYTVTAEKIQLDLYQPTYLAFGLAACTIALVINHFGKETLPKIVHNYVKVFVWCDAVLVFLQYRHPETYFSSLTYVLPFAIFYIMLHNNPYDGLSGCQGKDAFDAYVSGNIKHGKDFIVFFASFPPLAKLDEEGITPEMSQGALDAFRKVEKLCRHIKTYRMDHSTFTVVVEGIDVDANELMTELKKILDEACHKIMLHYELVGIMSHPLIHNRRMLKSMAQFMLDKFRHNTDESGCKLAAETDYQEFSHYYKIEQILLDIRNKMNLDDDRVLCYMQPIYNVRSDSFQTAEALMRLKVDDQIIYPKEFLGVAEKNNCVHALTCIMLNKVCRHIHEIQNDYCFDAITVNCSAEELSDWSLHDQLLKIIHRNNVDTAKIRLELTERAMLTDYNAAVHNIERLNLAGVQFYLDDFGTGYSNLERIISCPFHTIKFDKSLMHKAVRDTSVDDLLRHMVNVFKKNGFVLLVEGVENSEQSSYCINRGFDYMQGFRYAEPVPAKNITEYFELRSDETLKSSASF